ncbi:unnamed protein product, partial [Symbiodinium microadriaticum]
VLVHELPGLASRRGGGNLAPRCCEGPVCRLPGSASALSVNATECPDAGIP